MIRTIYRPIYINFIFILPPDNFTLFPHKLSLGETPVPFLAIWNLQTNRGIAFHLLADASWSMSAKRIFAPGENSYVGVELGTDAPNYMDAWKLHRYPHAHMPRRRLPVIYNTWLYKFDRIDFDSVAKQIPVAVQLGVEYLAIDAG